MDRLAEVAAKIDAGMHRRLMHEGIQAHAERR
jgi:hypothetical protein